MLSDDKKEKIIEKAACSKCKDFVAFDGKRACFKMLHKLDLHIVLQCENASAEDDIKEHYQVFGGSPLFVFPKDAVDCGECVFFEIVDDKRICHNTVFDDEVRELEDAPAYCMDFLGKKKLEE